MSLTLLAKNRKGDFLVQECLYAVANVFSDRNEEVGIQVNPDPLHIGLPYFKYYNSSSYSNATKVARISIEGPYYVIHRNQDGKENWVLNTRERKLLHQILNERSSKYSGYTVWQAIILDYNNEKFENLSLDEIKNCTVKNKKTWIKQYEGVNRFIDTIVPIDSPMPNYLNLS